MLTPVGHVSAPCPAQVMSLNIHKKLTAMQQRSAGVCAALNMSLGITWALACWMRPDLHRLCRAATLILCSLNKAVEPMIL